MKSLFLAAVVATLCASSAVAAVPVYTDTGFTQSGTVNQPGEAFASGSFTYTPWNQNTYPSYIGGWISGGRYQATFTSSAPVFVSFGTVYHEHWHEDGSSGGYDYHSGNDNWSGGLMWSSSTAVKKAQIEFTLPTSFVDSYSDGASTWWEAFYSYEGGIWVEGFAGPTALPGTTWSLKVAAIPEPSTWAMMLIGFFGVGGLLRSRSVLLA